MAKIIGSPVRYIQGKDELKNLCSYTEAIGDSLFVIIDASIKEIVETSVLASQKGTKCKITIEYFNGECCMKEIERIQAKVYETNCNVIVGVGGGKTIDTAKAVGYYSNHPVVIVPTIASTDAPCSALSVIYSEEGVFEKYLFLPSNPNIVLVDSQVIANAPARLLVAGIGDALATYFEARACYQSNALNCVGGTSTKAAMALAELCYKTLLEDGVKATLAMQNHVVTQAVENIIEANTYLSGIGFESGGLAGAHAVHNGLTAIEATHQYYHGEKVAFGTLVQLVLENADMEEIMEVIDLCESVGLPTSLEDLGVKEINGDEIIEVAKLVCSPDDTIKNMPFPVTVEDVYAAILTANALGKHI